MQPKKAAGTGFRPTPNNEVRRDPRQQELVLACPGLSLLTLGRLKKGTTPRRYNVASMVEPLIGLPFSDAATGLCGINLVAVNGFQNGRQFLFGTPVLWSFHIERPLHGFSEGWRLCIDSYIKNWQTFDV